MKIRVDSILPNSDQPRKEFDQDELESLAASIEEHGLLQPILVEQVGPDYILIDGERRWRAHKLLGRPDIEAVAKSYNNGNGTRFMHALIANVQRSNLNVVEEAHAYARLSDEFGMTIEQIAERTGYSDATISSRRFLLTLEPEIQQLFAIKALPYDYTTLQALKSLPDDVRISMALKFAQRGTPANYIVGACKRISGGKEKRIRVPKTAESKNGRNLIPADETNPALKRAANRMKEPAKADHYNALEQAGVFPPWAAVKSAVERECKACTLYDYASNSTCRQCPLPGFLARLMEKASQDDQNKN